MKEEEKLTKKERRQKAKEEKKNGQERKQNFKKLKTLTIFALIVATLVWGTIKIFGDGQAKSPEDRLNVTQNDWTRGGDSAAVTLVEYSDFQCPACGSYYPVLKKLEEEFGNDLKVVYRHFPLTGVHQNAYAAASAAEAAGLQGKFWEMHDMLFVRQPEWSELDDPSVKFIEYASTLEIDTDRFATDLASDQVKTLVDEDITSGNSFGINSTPTFFVNGRKITNPRGFDPFAKIIRGNMK